MKKKYILVSFLITVFGFLSVYLLQNYHILFDKPFARSITFEYPSFASTDSHGNRYIIDQSRRRVIACNKNEIVQAVIKGGSKEKESFFYANEVTSDDDGKIYVLNWVLDKSGFFMDREEIVRYTPNGLFDGVVYTRQYGEKDHTSALVQRGSIISLSVSDKYLRWFEINNRGIWSYAMSLSSGKIDSIISAEIPDANLLVSSVVRKDSSTIIYATKKGKIIEQREGEEPLTRYSADYQSETLSVPWCVGCGLNGDVLFSDLEKRKIFRLRESEGMKPLLSKEIIEKQGITTDEYTYYRLTARSDGMLTTTNDTYVVSADSDGKIVFYADSLQLSTDIVLRNIITSGLLVVWLILLCLIVRLFYVNVMNRKIPGLLYKAAGIIVIIGVSAVIISSLIVQNFSARYQKEALNKIAQMVQIVPKVINASLLTQITEQNEFMGEDYNVIREKLLSALNYNRDEWNNSYYFVLYRVINDQLYGFMYLNGDIGIYYPMSYFEDPESIYRRAYKGEIVTEKAEDEWGSWIDGVGPVYNKQGEVVGLLEIGKDLYSFNQENSFLIREIIFDVVTMLVIFVLVMIEVTFLMDMIYRRERRLALLKSGKVLRREDTHSDVFFARPVTFVMLTAISMSVVFIPLMMATFYHPVPGLSKELILGLPISSEMFFFGIVSVFSGRILARKGWRFMARLGFLFTGIGLLASGFSNGMLTFLVSLGITGIGTGFFYMSMRGFINEEQSAEMRSEAFAHFYSALIVGLSIGAVIGGFIADKFGYATVFFAAFAVMLIAVVFDVAYLRNVVLMQSTESKKVKAYSIMESARIFFSDPRIVGFFILIIVPTYVASTFLTYFFPIFAESNGVSSSDVGRLFILNGIFVIYLGPVLSRFFNKQFGPRQTMILGSALWACALAIVSLTGNMSGVIIALIIMGATEGFCVNAQNELFLGIHGSRSIGDDQAIGFFEMVGKFAETLGPILFSFALILGQAGGLLAIAVCVFVFAVVYVITVRQDKQG